MSRHLLQSLCIGAGASLAVLVAHIFGAFTPLAEFLGQFYRDHGLFVPGDVFRLQWLEFALILASGIGITWTVTELARSSERILVVLCALLIAMGLSPALALHNWLFEPFSTMLGAILGAIGGFWFSRTELGARKRLLERIVEDRVSNLTFGELLEDPTSLELSEGSRAITVLTCRILPEVDEGDENSEADATQAGRANPDRVHSDRIPSDRIHSDRIRICNLFLRSTSSFLVSRGAYVEAVGSDIVRASFGVFKPVDTHALHGCRAGLELKQRLRSLAREVETRWFHSPRFGIGLETGEATVGVFASGSQPRLGVNGEVTDLSYRLAGANARFSSLAIVGPELFERARDSFEFRPLEMFFHPEAAALMEIYELLGTPDSLSEADQQAREEFWKGVIRLREKDFDNALQHFSKARALGGTDDTLEYFIGEAQTHLAGSERKTVDLVDEHSKAGHARLIHRL